MMMTMMLVVVLMLVVAQQEDIAVLLLFPQRTTQRTSVSLALCTWSDRFTTNASGSSCGWMAQFDYLARLNQSATEVVGVRAAVSEATYTEHSIWRKQF